MATNVNILIDAIIGREGGYSDHPADRGGATRWGVTEAVARAYGYHGSMRDLPREIAANIYRERYWTRAGLPGVAAHYDALAAELFDIAVNMGVRTAGKFLQRSLNVLNGAGQLYSDIDPDGDIGPMTLAALAGYRRKRGVEGGDVLWQAVHSLRGARYIEISEERPANEAFTYGWFRRMVEMLKARFA